MFFDNIYSYWAYFGTMYLILLTIEDYRNNHNIDDRKNFFMYGITISLFTHIKRDIWYSLALVLFIIILTVALNKFKIFGEGDVNAFSWLFLGFGIIGVYKLFYFFLIFSVVLLLYIILKNHVFKIKAPSAFFGVILVIYVLACWLLKIY